MAQENARVIFSFAKGNSFTGCKVTSGQGERKGCNEGDSIEVVPESAVKRGNGTTRRYSPAAICAAVRAPPRAGLPRAARTSARDETGTTRTLPDEYLSCQLALGM